MAFLFVLFLSFLFGWSMPFLLASAGKRRWKQEGRLLIEQALIERQRLMQETDILIQEKKKQSSSEIEHIQTTLLKKQKSLEEKENTLKRKEESLEAFSLRLEEKRKKADQRQQEQQSHQEEIDQLLLRVRDLSKEEAFSLYIERLQEKQKEIFNSYKKEIIADLLYQEKTKISSSFDEILHSGYTLLSSHSHFIMLSLVNDNCIPRIIGANGKNIEGLSAILGCDLWVDDDKKQIILSSYDDKKRFVGERVLRELIAKHTYTLAQAQATKEKIESSLEQEFILKGKEALQAAHLAKTYPEAVLSLLGQLDLRSSLGQNVLLHSIETALMAKELAKELQLSPDLAGAIGLFHDIGKMLDSSWGDRHPARGKAFLEQQNVDNKICEGVGSHHAQSGHTTLEAMLVPYIDALSSKGCAQRLLQHTTSFKHLLQEIENLPEVHAASCLDGEHKLELLIRMKDKNFMPHQSDIEAILNKEKIHLPVEVRLLAPHTHSQETFLLLPKKSS